MSASRRTSDGFSPSSAFSLEEIVQAITDYQAGRMGTIPATVLG